jgi:peptide/nickel transport system substrate-binding protein
VRRVSNKIKKSLATIAILFIILFCYYVDNNYKDQGGKKKDLGPSIIYSEYGEKRVAQSPEKLPETARLRKDSLVVGISSNKGSFNPIYCNSIEDTWVCNLIFEGLIGHDLKGEPVGKLAESWSISEDGRTYSFKLKNNIKFSNGLELTAEDVKHTYTALCDSSYEGVYSKLFKLLIGFDEYNKGNANEVSGIKVLSPNEVSFTFKEQNYSLINDFTIGIISKEYYSFSKGNISAIEEKNKSPMGTGPYILNLSKESQEIQLTRNENYWSNMPEVKNIIMKVKDSGDIVKGLLSGELDIGRVAAVSDNINKLQVSGFLDLHLYDDNSFQYIGLNLRNNKFKDKKVRQALTYGLNRKAFIQAYYGEYGWACNVPFFKLSWAYPKTALEEYAYDKEKANKLLQDSGLTLKEDGFRYDEAGKRFSINWVTYENNSYGQSLINRVKEDWKAIGVEVKEEVLPFDNLVEKVFCSQDFEMYNMAWKLGIDPDPSPMFSFGEDSPGGYNSVGWRNATSEKLIKEALKERNLDNRKDIYEVWARLINEELPYIFINGNKEAYAVNLRIKNLELSTYVDWTDNIKKIKIVN